MKPRYDQPLSSCRRHRGSFETKMFGGTRISARANRRSPPPTGDYDGFEAAIVPAFPRRRLGILVDEQFAPPFCACGGEGYATRAREKERPDEFDFETEKTSRNT